MKKFYKEKKFFCSEKYWGSGLQGVPEEGGGHLIHNGSSHGNLEKKCDRNFILTFAVAIVR